jgi:hypothetical protein
VSIGLSEDKMSELVDEAIGVDEKDVKDVVLVLTPGMDVALELAGDDTACEETTGDDIIDDERIEDKLIKAGVGDTGHNANASQSPNPG